MAKFIKIVRVYIVCLLFSYILSGIIMPFGSSLLRGFADYKSDAGGEMVLDGKVFQYETFRRLGVERTVLVGPTGQLVIRQSSGVFVPIVAASVNVRVTSSGFAVDECSVGVGARSILCDVWDYLYVIPAVYNLNAMIVEAFGWMLIWLLGTRWITSCIIRKRRRLGLCTRCCYPIVDRGPGQALLCPECGAMIANYSVPSVGSSGTRMKRY